MQDGLEARVERLERENRRLKRWGLLAAVIAVGVVLMGQALGPKVSDELRTRSLHVVDEAGRTRAHLNASKPGPELDLFDEAGKVRVSLDVLGNAPGLTLRDEADAVRVSLSVFEDSPGLTLSDGAGETRLMLMVFEDSPGLTLFDGVGNPRASILARPEGPNVVLQDVEGFSAILGATDVRTAASLALLGKSREVLWEAP